MTKGLMLTTMRAPFVFLILTCVAAPARAQSRSVMTEPCAGAPGTKSLFTGSVNTISRVPSRSSLSIMALGAAAAAGTHAVDTSTTRVFAGETELRRTFQPGAVLGGTPLQMGAAFATYAIGRALHKPCAARLGADLVQAQVLAQGLSFAIKSAANRTRPDGNRYSFPSGHTTVSFASATILQRHFGWKVGIPAYAVASYVAASRVQMKRHYVSDVTFGAALGIVAGRSVPIGRAGRLVITPVASSGGAGAGLTWVGRQ
jgi:membrane-associated phospholipid phosphatase